MDYLFFLLLASSIVVMILGLIKPGIVIKWGNKRSRGRVLLIYGLSAFVFLVMFGITAPPIEEQNRQKYINEFLNNRTAIINKAIETINEERYDDLISETQKYIVANDIELDSLRSKAQAILKIERDASRREEILAEVKTIPALGPAVDYPRLLSLYGELLRLSPGSQEYREMYKSIQDWQEYDRIAAIKREREQFEAKKLEWEQQDSAERKTKIEAQFSSWDGSHRNLERFIKQSMNDPDSYKHVETVYSDMGSHLVVRTTFRGKNPFGGMVLNYIDAKVDLDGNILEIIQQGP